MQVLLVAGVLSRLQHVLYVLMKCEPLLPESHVNLTLA